MTKIYIRGLLGKKFGNYFYLNVSSALSALKLIDANKNKFLKEMRDLSKKNINYYIICDGVKINDNNGFLETRKINRIDIIPAIVGSGELVAIGLGLVTSAGALTLTGSIVAVLTNTLISVGLSFLTSALMKQGSPPLQANAANAPQTYASAGGAVSSIESAGKSYIFSNNQNIASQGSAIPVGYGKFKISSNVIESSIFNFRTDLDFNTQSIGSTTSNGSFENLSY